MGGRTKRSGEDVRMSDIARHAGVSPMTVSRALRAPSTVSEKLRRKVDAAVREFGYLPNRIAASLSSKRSNIVGLIVPSIRNSLYASMIQAISDMLRANGFHLMIANSGHRLRVNFLTQAAYGSARRTVSGSRSNQAEKCLSTGDVSPRREANPRNAFSVAPSCEQPRCTEPASSARTHWLPGIPGITMMVADGGLGYGHHLGPEKYRGGCSRMVVRIGGKARTARAR